MSAALTTEISTEGFVLMLRDLQSLAPDKTFREILLDQTAAILRFCIKHTRAANRNAIIKRAIGARQNYYEFPSGHVVYLSKKYGGTWLFLDSSSFKPTGKKKAPSAIIGGKTWHDMSNWHWSDERWGRYQAFIAQAERIDQERKAAFKKAKNGNDRAASVTAALASRGVAKHSWYQIAEALAITSQVAVEEWIKTATPQNGNVYQNGTARAVLDTAAAYIEMENNNPACIRTDGQSLVNSAIRARRKAFEIDVEKGVFRDFKTRAARYPGLFVAPA